MNLIKIALSFSVFTLSAVSAQATKLLLLNEQKVPVVNATVMVGVAENDPFQNNKVLSNGQGIAEIPDSWDKSLPVTVSATGYLRSTFMGALASNINTLQLTREEQKQSLEVKGDATNFGEIKKDGKVDFALVYPAFTYSQFSRFDVSSVMSSDVDVLKVITEEIAIPSNVSLPNQSENYILPITLNKPTYRMGFKTMGDYKMIATRGQFPLKQVVGDLRDGKSFFEVMKYFKFLGGGEKVIQVNAPLTGQDIDVNMTTFDNKIVAKASTLPADTLQLSFSVIEQDGLYSATDLKQIDAGQSAELVLPSKRDGNLLVSLMVSKSEASKFQNQTRRIHELLLERLKQQKSNPQVGAPQFDPINSAYFLLDNFTQNVDVPPQSTDIGSSGLSLAQHKEGEETPVFLNLIPKPAVTGMVLKATKPQDVAGIEPVATRVFLSEVERVTRGKKQVDLSYRIWEVTQLGWATEIKLPSVMGQLNPNKRYKWDVLYTGRMTSSKKVGEYFLDDVTHVTRNSVTQ